MRGGVPGVLDGLSDTDAADVARCARVLLRYPLLRPGGPDGDLLPLVHRHRESLREVFGSLLGYRLVVRRRFARLHKAGPAPGADRGEAGMTPRSYAYLCLAMAALTGAGRQVLLSRLAADVRAAGAEAGVPAADGLADRRALTAALRHLTALGVITETDGSVAGAEALITVDTDLLGELLAAAVDADSAAGLVAAAGAAACPGQAVRRRLVEDPVVLHADLPPEQAEWLLRNQRRESVLLERCFGLVAEVRAEGVAVTDPEEYLTDVVFPGPGTVARVALLALPELLERGPRADGKTPVSRGRLREVCEALVADFPAAWSRQATDDAEDLVAAVSGLLVRLGLAAPDGAGGWLLSPAAHRWRPRPDDAPGRVPEPAAAAEEPGWSLFDSLTEDDTEGAP